MVDVRLVPLSAADLAAWRDQSEAAGSPLPVPEPGDGYDAREVVVDDVAVGGVVLTTAPDGLLVRCSIRELQTTLSPDDGPRWAAVVAALEACARELGADTMVTSIAPDLVPPFRDAGFGATMTTHGKELEPDSPLELQEDQRVAVRPMTPAERTAFVTEAQVFLRSGMDRAGVAGADATLAGLDGRLAALAEDPPPTDELLMVGTVDGTPVGRAWATLRRADDGTLDFLGNTLDLFPEHRGQGLTKSFLGALRRHVHEIGVRAVTLNVYGHDAGARRTFLDNGAGIGRVLLRKDL
ncbi:hypothetical protein [uncultured Nocardioides sp.]|uniref:hypothetical protein n=1 Tax=uncultured Nocardioides sp. TaxID=198441 RepID=UPI00262B2736|nr:hypothetical protein [uncultured Nocardioides sp.]